MFIIYRITNTIDKKSYIGFTSRGIVKRWRQHLYVTSKGSGTYLHNSIRKYGATNFQIEVLEEGWNPKIGKEIREPYWISVLKPEYNMTDGGDGTLGHVHTDATKRKMSEASSGRKKSQVHCQNISKSRKGRTPRLGCKLSEETKKKMSLSNKGQIPWNKGKRKGCTNE